MRTETNGYYTLHGEGKEIHLHFSTNFLRNLRNKTKKEFDQVLYELSQCYHNDGKDIPIEEIDMITVTEILGEITFAGAEAYREENETEKNYNIAQLRNYISQLSEEEVGKLTQAITWNITPPVSDNNEKKKMGAVKN